jgi:hypothetical protein
MATTPTRDIVENGYDGKPVTNGELSDTEADQLITEAEKLFDSVFSDQVLFTAEVQGNQDHALRVLSRHKWALALGETTSESQSGGSQSHNIPQSTERSLRRTTYGLEFLEYVRGGEPNISIFST